MSKENSVDVIKGPISQPTHYVPLVGYLVDEDKEQVKLQDRKGYWIIKKSDIVKTSEVQGLDQRFDGKPVCLYLRDGANITQIVPTRVSFSSVPMTISREHVSPNKEGIDELNLLQEIYSRSFGFPLAAGSVLAAGRIPPIIQPPGCTPDVSFTCEGPPYSCWGDDSKCD
jgi:hypothetical protein